MTLPQQMSAAGVGVKALCGVWGVGPPVATERETHPRVDQRLLTSLCA